MPTKSKPSSVASEFWPGNTRLFVSISMQFEAGDNRRKLTHERGDGKIKANSIPDLGE